MAWDYWLSRIGKEVADEQGVSYMQVLEMYDGYMRGIGKAIRRHQQVLVYNFGVFRIAFRKVHRATYRFFNRYNEGLLTREQLLNRVTYMMPIWRASKYHRPRKGQGYEKEDRRIRLYGKTVDKPYEKTAKARGKEIEAAQKRNAEAPLQGSDSAAQQLQHVQDRGRPGCQTGGEGSTTERPQGVQGLDERPDMGQPKSF